MFNALSSGELLACIGGVLRRTAGVKDALEDYERSQLLSAYSVSRLLAAEQAAERELLAWTRAALEGALASERGSAVEPARERIAGAADGVELGDALAGLLDTLAPDDPARGPVRRVLAEMADREVAALARVA